VLVTTVGVLVTTVGVLVTTVGVLATTVEVLATTVGVLTTTVGVLTTTVGALATTVGVLASTSGVRSRILPNRYLPTVIGKCGRDIGACESKTGGAGRRRCLVIPPPLSIAEHMRPVSGDPGRLTAWNRWQALIY
jgi:hypothetical protein